MKKFNKAPLLASIFCGFAFLTSCEEKPTADLPQPTPEHTLTSVRAQIINDIGRFEGEPPEGWRQLKSSSMQEGLELELIGRPDLMIGIMNAPIPSQAIQKQYADINFHNSVLLIGENGETLAQITASIDDPDKSYFHIIETGLTAEPSNIIIDREQLLGLVEMKIRIEAGQEPTEKELTLPIGPPIDERKMQFY